MVYLHALRYVRLEALIETAIKNRTTKRRQRLPQLTQNKGNRSPVVIFCDHGDDCFNKIATKDDLNVDWAHIIRSGIDPCGGWLNDNNKCNKTEKLVKLVKTRYVKTLKTFGGTNQRGILRRGQQTSCDENEFSLMFFKAVRES